MRIYTKTGDKGKTSLGNGKRIFKSESIIEALGSIDELNCFIGLFLSQEERSIDEDVITLLRIIQNDLFDLGADLCMIQNESLEYSCFKDYEQRVCFLEEKIDFYNDFLSPLETFILPGGTTASSLLHCTRSIARRAERSICLLVFENSNVNLHPIITYLNRLSDALFILARFFNDKGKNDIKWVKNRENI